MPGTESIFAVGDMEMYHRGSGPSQNIGPEWKKRHGPKAEFSGNSQICVTDRNIGRGVWGRGRVGVSVCVAVGGG